jgi:DNA-binding CsgD family transcriptional regulator
MFTTAPLLGRQRELSEIEQLFLGAASSGGVLVIRGDAGIGKSSILIEAVALAESAGMRVSRTTAVQSETNLPFAGLHLVLQPWLDGIDRLAGRQRTAMLAAFGVSDEVGPDTYLIALATLNLLADTAESGPILVVVDDAQWLDGSSAEVFTFVARRLGADPITFLAAVRDGDASPLLEGGLPEMHLQPLDEGSAQTLLDRQSPDLAGPARSRLLRESAGNPLALVELPGALETEQLSGDASLPAVLPLTQRLERAYAARVSEMPGDTRRVLLIAAADGVGGLGEILAAAGVMGVVRALEALEPAIAGNLVDIDADRLRFRHPVIRSAIYQAATQADRRLAHAMLAETLHDKPDRRAWHLGESVLGPDEGVARVLDEAAARALDHGAPAVAVAVIERAARLSEEESVRATRLLEAAKIAFQLGRPDLVARLTGAVEPVHLTRHEQARRTWIGEAFDDGISAGSASGARSLEGARAAQDVGDTELTISLLVGAALHGWWTDAANEQRRKIVAAVDGLPADAMNPRLLMTLAVAAPIDRGASVLESLSRLGPGSNVDPQWNRALGVAASAVGDFALASEYLEAAATDLRAQGRLGQLSVTLVQHAWAAIHLGDRVVAMGAAEEGYRLALESAQPIWVARARVAQAMLAGQQGMGEEAEALAAEAERAVLARGVRAVLAEVAHVRGLTALSSGRPRDAFDHMRRMFDPSDPAHHYMKRYLAIGDLAEAAAHGGDRAEAQAALDEAELAGSKTPAPRLHIGLRYARAALANDDAAEPLFHDALAADLTRWPFDRARLLLLYGAWLRRQRRRAESRSPLRNAAAAFDALGIVSWGDRARQELRASGETSRRRSVASWDQLSPQELHIARLAAEGLSNREIGERLYLSHRTVGTHLFRAFPKLGITSRAQLGRALTTESRLPA